MTKQEEARINLLVEKEVDKLLTKRYKTTAIEPDLKSFILAAVTCGFCLGADDAFQKAEDIMSGKNKPTTVGSRHV